MTDPLLHITARCRGDGSCRFDGGNLFIDIAIANPQAATVGVPLAFLQKTGPKIRLVDARTRAETFLKTNLADFALKQQLTQIPAGGSAALEWVINADELLQFGAPVDVAAEITVRTDVTVGNQLQPFSGVARLRIVDKGKP